MEQQPIEEEKTIGEIIQEEVNKSVEKVEKLEIRNLGEGWEVLLQSNKYDIYNLADLFLILKDKIRNGKNEKEKSYT